MPTVCSVVAGHTPRCHLRSPLIPVNTKPSNAVCGQQDRSAMAQVIGYMLSLVSALQDQRAQHHSVCGAALATPVMKYGRSRIQAMYYSCYTLLNTLNCKQ